MNFLYENSNNNRAVHIKTKDKKLKKKKFIKRFDNSSLKYTKK